MRDYGYSPYGLSYADMVRHGIMTVDEVRAQAEYYMRLARKVTEDEKRLRAIPLRVVMTGE